MTHFIFVFLSACILCYLCCMKKNEDYQGFVDKFKPKKTTDDCYTPKPVYDVVLAWVDKHVGIKGRKVVRPFYPGGDFENYNYPEGCVVVDNPPFSIIRKIALFYVQRGIGFFLFSPFASSIHKEYSSVFIGTSITYENGAVVGTAFITNLLGDIQCMSAPDLAAELKRVLKTPSPLRKFSYPNSILRAAQLNTFATRGIPFCVHKKSCHVTRNVGLEKKLFGNSLLLSEKAAAEKAAAEKAAAEKAAGNELVLSAEDLAVIKELV